MIMDLTRSYCVIGLTSKKRELKRIPRLSSLTDELRLYIVTATELLLVHYFLPYLPAITMKHTGSELVRKVIHVSRSTQSSQTSIHAMVNIDFEKWKNHQRDQLVRPVFRDKSPPGYDNMISQTHEIFSNSIFYSAEDYVMLSSGEFGHEKSGESWFNHLAGVEGLRQKGWTIVTSTALNYCAEQMDQKQRFSVQATIPDMFVRARAKKQRKGLELFGTTCGAFRKSRTSD
ncbi:hypothetical protein COOONC_15904 [Cooperia oncophora]